MESSAAHSTWVDTVLGSEIPYVTYAIPFFFLLIGIEIVYSLLSGRYVYRLNDSISDLACGIIDQTAKLFVEVFVLAAYIYLYAHYRLFDIIEWSLAGKIAAAFVLFLGVDLCFYCHHRLGHELKIGWATHVVHHQSEDFNLIVALRQGTIEHHLMFFCYLPLAILGFPPTWYMAMFAFNLIWQFWVHTRFVGKLGPIEWIFNTPSHHRVHHGRNPKYLDKNYGGTLIIWDRLFGTFQEEEEEPVYGITKPLASWNPLWANVHVWVEIAQDARQTRNWWDRIRIWFMPLNWVPKDIPAKPEPPEVSVATVHKYDVPLPPGLVTYGLLHFVATFLVSLILLEVGGHHASFLEYWDLVVVILWSLLSIGGIFERRRWALWVELGRLAVLPIWVYARVAGTDAEILIVALAASASALSALALWGYRRMFDAELPEGEPAASSFSA